MQTKLKRTEKHKDDKLDDYKAIIKLLTMIFTLLTTIVGFLNAILIFVREIIHLFQH